MGEAAEMYAELQQTTRLNPENRNYILGIHLNRLSSITIKILRELC
jgi:hypothetical protein